MMLEILTGVLVVVTGFYAWATFRILCANEDVVRVAHGQLEAMREQNEVLMRPYVQVSPLVFPEHPSFFLRITNSGKTCAKSLRLEMDPPYHRGKGDRLNPMTDYPAFSDEIQAFAPGAELLFPLDEYFVVLGDETDRNMKPMRFSITASYSFGDKVVSESTPIDLGTFLHSHAPHDPVVRQLKAIAENIKEHSQ